MPEGWSPEFGCRACGYAVPSDGTKCCSTPRPGDQLVQWACRLSGGQLLSVAPNTTRPDVYWFRVLLFPNIAYGDAPSIEAGARCATMLKDAFEAATALRMTEVIA